MIEEKEKMMYV